MLITDINSFYTYLQSQKTAQQFLYQSYQNMEGINPEIKSYENCNAFIYFLKHGIQFYTAGNKADHTLKPLLLFYGMTHLDRKSTRLNSSHVAISYAVFCLKKK